MVNMCGGKPPAVAGRRQALGGSIPGRWLRRRNRMMHRTLVRMKHGNRLSVHDVSGPGGRGAECAVLM